MSEKIRLVEVGLRDGLQNEKTLVSTQNKVSFFKKLKQAGLKNIEVTSFVRPDRIPQMKDAKDFFALVKQVADRDDYLPCLIPNLKGLETAIDVGVQEIALFTATSEKFNKKNINASVAESLTRLEAVALEAQTKKLKMRGYISTVFGCPYEGQPSLGHLKMIVEKMISWGVDDISLGDTTGVANPKQVEEIIGHLKGYFSLDQFSLHFHDTRGLALANILKALECGIRSFDSSAGGLGGCPYAKGATGNVATEDVVYMLQGMGYETGIDLKKLIEASAWMLKILGKESPSKFHQAYLKTGY